MKEFENVILLESPQEAATMMIEHGGGIGVETAAGEQIGHVPVGDKTFKGEWRESLILAGVIGYLNGKVVLAGK